MDAIIGVAVSMIGAHFYELDFCTLYTFISVGIELFRYWNDSTNDKPSLK